MMGWWLLFAFCVLGWIRCLVTVHRKVSEKEMRDGRHAFGRHALAGDCKFRLVRYTPAPTEKK